MTTKQARIEAMLDDALRVYRANQVDEADPVSIAFDAGRIDGIKQVLRELEAREKEPATLPHAKQATP